MNGQVWAWATFLVGLCCGGFAWARTSRMQLRHPLAKALRLGFTVVVALAVFSNLSFLAWIAGLPLEMGVIKQGKMAEHYWLGPITLIYAVIVWGQLKRAALEK